MHPPGHAAQAKRNPSAVYVYTAKRNSLIILKSSESIPQWPRRSIVSRELLWELLVAALLAFTFLGQLLTDGSKTINKEEDYGGQQSLVEGRPEVLTDVIGNGEKEP